MEHAQMGDGDSADGSGSDVGEHASASGSGGICKWFKDSTDVTLRPGATGLWVNVFNQSQGRSGQVRRLAWLATKTRFVSDKNA